MTVAVVRFDGTTIFAKPVRQNADGTWFMLSQSHHPRFSIGSPITIAPTELMGVTGEELLAQMAKEQAPTIAPAQNTGSQEVGNSMAGNLTEIDGLVSLTQTVSNLKALASDAAKKFQGSVANLNDAVTTTHAVSDQLDKAASDIRGALGVKTNGPATTG